MAAGFTYEALEEQLVLVQGLKLTMLTGGLASIQKPSSWKVGEVQFTNASSNSSSWVGLKDLLEMEKTLMEMMRTMFPSEVVITHQDAITPFGHDLTEYENEPVPGQ